MKVSVVGKNHPWMLKLMSENTMRIRMFACLKVSPHISQFQKEKYFIDL